MKKAIISFINDEYAQSTVEYVLIASTLAIVGYGAIKLFSKSLTTSFNKTASKRAGIAGVNP